MAYDSKTYGKSPFDTTDGSSGQTIRVPAVTLPEDKHDRSERKPASRKVGNSDESLSGAYPPKSRATDQEPELPSNPPAIKLGIPKLSIFHCSRGVSGWPYIGEIAGWCVHWLAFGFIRSLASPRVVRYMSMVFSLYTLVAVVLIAGYVIARSLTILELRTKEAQAVANEALRLDSKNVDSLSDVSENANEALLAIRQSVVRTRKFVVSLFAFLVAYLLVSVLY